MFRDERVFRAILFSSPSLRNLEAARALLPKRAVTTAEPAAKCPGGVVEHLYYYSQHEFTRNIDLLEQAKEKRHGVMQYRYNMYLIGVATGKAFSVMLAVPFKAMAQEIYSHLRNVTRGRDFQFSRILLNRTLEISENGDGVAALLKVTRIKFNVEGDGFADSVGLVGTHLAQSTTLRSFLVSLKGPTMTPELIRISLDDTFSLATDQLGHYWFRVAKSGANLTHIPEVLKFMSKLGLVEAGSAFPHMKHFDGSDDEAAQVNE